MNFHFKSHSESANGLARSHQLQQAQYQLQREPPNQSSPYQYHNQATAQRQYIPQPAQSQQRLNHHHHYHSQVQTSYPSPAQRHFHNQQPQAYQNQQHLPAQLYQTQPADRQYQSQLIQSTPATPHQQQPMPQQPPQQPQPFNQISPRLQPIVTQSTNPGQLSEGSNDGSIIRIHSDSQQSLDRLFNPSTSETSVPLRQRNLPSSFFNPRPLHGRSTSFDLRPAQNSVHMRTQSVLAPMTGILSDSAGSDGLLHSSGYYSSSRTNSTTTSGAIYGDVNNSNCQRCFSPYNVHTYSEVHEVLDPNDHFHTSSNSSAMISDSNYDSNVYNHGSCEMGSGGMIAATNGSVQMSDMTATNSNGSVQMSDLSSPRPLESVNYGQANSITHHPVVQSKVHHPNPQQPIYEPPQRAQMIMNGNDQGSNSTSVNYKGCIHNVM